MAMIERTSRVKREIAELSKVSLKGRVFDETDEHVTISTGNALYEVPRQSIENIAEIGQEAGTKVVSLSLKADAPDIKSVAVAATELGMAVIDDDDYCGTPWRWPRICKCWCTPYDLTQVQDYATSFRQQM